MNSKVKFRNSAWALAMIPLALPQFAVGQSIEDSLEMKTRELIPVVIQGIRVNEKSPYAVSNLDEKEIREENQGRDIPYLLNATPSVVVSSDAGAGVGYSSVRIRGTDAARINFTINGVPVNDPESQVAIFVNFPDLLSSTNSIQVQRGVGSSTNGAGAFGASVNLSNLGQSLKPYAEVNNSFGSFQTFKHTVKAGTGLLKGGFQFDARASKISSEGFIDRAFSDLKSFQFTAGWLSKDERSSAKFNVFTGKERTGQAWDGVPEDSLKTNRTYNGVGLKEDGRYFDDQTDNYQQDYYQLFFDHEFKSPWKASLGLFLTRGRGYYNEYRVNDKFSTYGLPPFIAGQADTLSRTNLIRQRWLDNYYYGSIFSLAYEKDKSQLILGGALTKYDGDHYGFVKWADYGVPADYRWYQNEAFKTDMNLYAKLQQQIGNHLYAFGDLQFRTVEHRMYGFRQNPDVDVNAQYNFVNPKFGLSYIQHHRGGRSSKAYFSFAMAGKEPNRKDFEESPYELPKPEKLYDFELGYNYLMTKASVGVNLYYMYYLDQLVYSGKINDYGVYGRINVDQSYRRGVELVGSYKPFSTLELSGNLALSQNEILNFDEYIDDYDEGGQIKTSLNKTDISFSPNIVASAMVTYEPFQQQAGDWNFFVDLFGKHVGRQFLDNTSNKGRSINPYSLFDLRFRYQMKTSLIPDLGIHLALHNILDTKYEANGYTFSYKTGGAVATENFYFPQAGFNFMLGVNFRF